ncbi:MAG: transposase, partial [bacterium]|nr:transposase [bacterium]
VVMVAFVLEMIWRQIGGVSELARLVQTEAILWEQPRKVSQQALSQRLTSLPADLFLKVLQAVLPVMRARWFARERPLPPELVWAAERYRGVLAVDGSTLDALIRKMGLLRELPKNPLAGKMTALLDLCTRLPEQLWYESNPKAHDQRFWPQILATLKAGSLLIFDKGYLNFSRFSQLRQAQVTFITRSKSNLVYTLEHALLRTAAVHDYRVWIGKGETRQRVRLIE